MGKLSKYTVFFSICFLIIILEPAKLKPGVIIPPVNNATDLCLHGLIKNALFYFHYRELHFCTSSLTH